MAVEANHAGACQSCKLYMHCQKRFTGGSLNKEVKGRPLYGGEEEGGSLIKEVKRRPLYGGGQRRESLI